MRRTLLLTGLLKKEEGKILAKCLEIDGIDTFGSTIEKAKKNLIESIELYFETAKELGILDKAVKKIEQKQKKRQEPLQKLVQRNYEYYTPIREKLVGLHA